MPGADVGGLLRTGVATLCLAAGVLHVSAAADHRGMAGHVVFFLVVAAAQSALGAAVLLALPGRWLAAGTAVNLAVVLVWVLSRTTGLPVDGSSAPEALGFKDGITTMIELGAAAGAGLWWLLPDGARRVALPSGRLASGVLGTGVWVAGAGGLFAGHTHSPGHTHTAPHAHATSTAVPNTAAHPHSGETGHDNDHTRRAASPAAFPGSASGGHTHAAASHDPTRPAGHQAGHQLGPEAHAPAPGTSATGTHDHGPGHPGSEAQPRPSHATGHHHSHAAAAPAGDDDSGQSGDGHDHRHDGGGGDHRHSGDDRDRNHDEGGSGNDRGDKDDGASPLEEVLKLIRPR